MPRAFWTRQRYFSNTSIVLLKYAQCYFCWAGAFKNDTVIQPHLRWNAYTATLRSRWPTDGFNIPWEHADSTTAKLGTQAQTTNCCTCSDVLWAVRKTWQENILHNITDLDEFHFKIIFLCFLFNPGDLGQIGEEGDQGKMGKNGPPGLPGIEHPSMCIQFIGGNCRIRVTQLLKNVHDLFLKHFKCNCIYIYNQSHGEGQFFWLHLFRLFSTTLLYMYILQK